MNVNSDRVTRGVNDHPIHTSTTLSKPHSSSPVPNLPPGLNVTVHGTVHGTGSLGQNLNNGHAGRTSAPRRSQDLVEHALARALPRKGLGAPTWEPVPELPPGTLPYSAEVGDNFSAGAPVASTFPPGLSVTFNGKLGASTPMTMTASATMPIAGSSGSSHLGAAQVDSAGSSPTRAAPSQREPLESTREPRVWHSV